MSLQIHLSIETLEKMVEAAEKIRKASPESVTTIIRITKTAYKQFPELEDTIATEILTIDPDIIEG